MDVIENTVDVGVLEFRRGGLRLRRDDTDTDEERRVAKPATTKGTKFHQGFVVLGFSLVYLRVLGGDSQPNSSSRIQAEPQIAIAA
jgi:hypothetical protein